jgi:hypothetical protein
LIRDRESSFYLSSHSSLPAERRLGEKVSNHTLRGVHSAGEGTPLKKSNLKNTDKRAKTDLATLVSIIVAQKPYLFQ